MNLERAIRRRLDENPLLSEFAKARQAAHRPPLSREKEEVRKAAPRSLTGEEILAYRKTTAPERSPFLEEALAYRIECRWYNYTHFSLGDFAASRISDAEYIEAMFLHYSNGCCRLL